MLIRSIVSISSKFIYTSLSSTKLSSYKLSTKLSNMSLLPTSTHNVYTENKSSRCTLYPTIQPYTSGYLKVSNLHTIYYEQCGNQNGKAVVMLHGGPGGGLNESYRSYFDPEIYNIILIDQRGSGKSTPFAELRENTTWDLVDDCEKIRILLNIEKLVVFGGSWGSTLALAYAQTYPTVVKALILRGIFMLRREELEFFYQEGTSWIYPDAFEEFKSVIPEVERYDLLSAYHRRLTSSDYSEEERLRCAQAWCKWEMVTSRLIVDPENLLKAEDPKFALAFSRIENHYFINGGFFKTNDQILTNTEIIRAHNIPCVIVQGRYDMVCPMKSAWDLHKVWPESELIIVNDAGHSMKEDGILSELVKATNKFKDL